MKLKLQESIENGTLAVFVGAGISTLEPSCLPSWWALNHAILDALAYEAQNISSEVHRVKDFIKEREENGLLPPEFVAEIISNRVGINYFEILRVLEGDEPNYVHFALAELAKQGKLKWIITTNFDTLIEKAFEVLNTSLKVCVDPTDYNNLLDDNVLTEPETCVLIKLHGTATRPETCIDTLAQRKIGLHPNISVILHQIGLQSAWLFLGYSGADFEAEPNYLGLRGRAKEGKGVFWLQLEGTNVKDTVSTLLEQYGQQKGFLDYGTLPNWIQDSLNVYLHDLDSTPLIKTIETKENSRQQKINDLKAKTQSWSADLGSFICATILADIGTQAGNYIDAKLIFQTILSSYEDKLPPLYQGITFQELGSIEFHFANNEKALEYYQKALEPYREAKEDLGYNASIQAIGNILFDLGKFKEAEKIYKEYLQFTENASKDNYLFALKVIIHFYIVTKDIDKALNYLKPAYDITVELGDEIIRMDLLFSAKDIENLYGNYEQAENILQEIVQISSRLGDERRFIEANIGLAQLYWNQSKQEEAFEKLQLAQEHSKLVFDVKNEIRIKDEEGKFQYFLGNYEQARMIFEEILEKAEEIDNIDLKSSIWQNLGLVYQEEGKFDNAITLYTEAIEQTDSIGYKYRSAGLKNNLANIYQLQGELDKALGIYLEIASYYESILDKLNLSSSNGNIANIFYRKGIYSEAKNYYLKTLTTFEELDYFDGILRTLHNVAGVIYLEGNIEESKKYFLQSITKAYEYNQPGLAEQFSLSYANVLFQTKEFDGAINYYKKINEGAKSRNDNYLRSISLYSLGLAYMNINKIKEAKENLKNSIELMEGLDQQLDIYTEAIKYLEQIENSSGQ